MSNPIAQGRDPSPFRPRREASLVGTTVTHIPTPVGWLSHLDRLEHHTREGESSSLGEELV